MGRSTPYSKCRISRPGWGGCPTAGCWLSRCATVDCCASREARLLLQRILCTGPAIVQRHAVDAQGRAYIGNFGFDLPAGAAPAPTNLVLVAPDGRVRLGLCDTCPMIRGAGNEDDACGQVSHKPSREETAACVAVAIAADAAMGFDARACAATRGCCGIECVTGS